jgi:hypothetical protein
MIILAFAALVSVASDTGCVHDLDSAMSIIGHDYAGFASLSSAQNASLAVLLDTLRVNAGRVGRPDECTELLQRYIAFFRDGHLSLSGPRRPAATNSPKSADVGRRTTLTFLDDSTALLTLPDFGSAKPIDSVLAAHPGRLATTPHLIIDIRGNGGGSDNSFASVMRLIYTDSVFRNGVEALASPGNIGALRARFASAPDGPRRRAADSVLTLMERHQGEFVLMSAATYYKYDAVIAMARDVVIISGRFCASSCEQFLLDAKQSRKVTVLVGQNTYGMLDFSNVRTAPLPSGERTIGLLMMRVIRDRSLNNIGVAPDVVIPLSDTADALGFARRYLRTHPRDASQGSVRRSPPMQCHLSSP